MFSPSETSELGLGVPARRPLNPALRPWRGALGQDRAEEKERKETVHRVRLKTHSLWREAAALHGPPGGSGSSGWLPPHCGGGFELW